MSRHRKMALAASLLVVLGLVGPVMGQAEESMPAWVTMAEIYDNPYAEKAGGSLSAETLSAWWTVFHDDTLTELIGIALAHNLDMVQARSRLQQARASLGMTKAAYVPWVDGSGGWVRTKLPENVISELISGKPGNSGGDAVHSLSYMGLDASWEPDIFGKNKAKVRASQKTVEIERSRLYGTWVSLSAEVAMNYITLRTLQEELVITEDHVQRQREKVSLLEGNEVQGLVSSLPAAQAAYGLHEAEAKIPELKVEIADTLHRLSLLTGTVPGALNEKLLTPSPLADIDGRLYLAVPAEALRQRPDVRAAEMAWSQQMDWTKVAEAEAKPKISLLGILGLATTAGGLFSAGTHGWAITPQVSYPLFHGGALRRNIQVQREKEKEKQAAYEQTVLQAAAEVRGAMVAVSQDKAKLDAWQAGALKAKEAWELADNQYTCGLADYMSVLDGERQYLAAKQNYTLAQGQHLMNMVMLFKALGGGWMGVEGEQAKG